MPDPSRRPQDSDLVPHPDDEEEVRAGLEEAQRGNVLSEDESAGHVRTLLGEERPGE